MPRGKGNKLYDISGKKLAAREEFLAGITVVPKGAALLLWTGEQAKTLEWLRTQGIPGSTRAARQRSAARVAAENRPSRGASADHVSSTRIVSGRRLAKLHEPVA